MTAEPQKTRIVKQWKHSAPLISCRFDPAGRFVFAGAQDNSIQRWDLATGEVTGLEGGHDSWVRGLAFHAESDVLLTGGYDGRLCWWPVAAERPTPTRVVETGQGWVRAVAVSPDGRYVATAGNDGLVKLWSFDDGRLVRSLSGHDCHVYNVGFHPETSESPVLISSDLKGVVIHWDPAKGMPVRKLDAAVLYKYDKGFRADIGGIRAMTFSADGKRLACGGITNVSNAFAGVGNPMSVRFDWESGKALQKHIQKAKPRGVVWGLVFHPQGFLAGATGGGGGGFLLFWNEEKAEEFHQLKLPSQARDLDLHRDGLRLATAHYDRHVRILEMRESPEKKTEKKPAEDPKKKS